MDVYENDNILGSSVLSTEISSSLNQHFLNIGMEFV